MPTRPTPGDREKRVGRSVQTAEGSRSDVPLNAQPGQASGGAAARSYTQRNRESLRSRRVIIWMAAMTIHVDIYEWIFRHPYVSQIFILSLCIAPMTAPTAILTGMDVVPLAFSIHRICLLIFMAGDTRRIRRFITALSKGC